MGRIIFRWRTLLFIGIALSITASLIFASGFVFGGTDFVVNGFAWCATIGSLILVVWALRYFAAGIAEIAKACYSRGRYGYWA